MTISSPLIILVIISDKYEVCSVVTFSFKLSVSQLEWKVSCTYIKFMSWKKNCTLTNSTQKITNWPGFPLLCTSHFLNVPIPGCANLVARPFEGLLLPSLSLRFPTKCSQGPLRWDPISNSLCLICTWAQRWNILWIHKVFNLTISLAVTLWLQAWSKSYRIVGKLLA